MTLEELDREINNKISQNDEFVRYTYFELKVRHNLSEGEIDETEERYDFKVSSNGEVSRCMHILSPRNVPVTNFHNIIKNSNENLLFFSFSDRIKVIKRR